MEKINHQEFRESEPRLLFKITLMRHEKPLYKDEGHDLTPEGVEGAIKTGKRLVEDGTISDTDEVVFAHSPAPRAKGTTDFVAKSAGLEDKPRISVDQLRPSDMPNKEFLYDWFLKTKGDVELISRSHYEDSMFEDRPDIIEPQSNKKDRLYRSLEYLIRWFEKHPIEGKTPHVIAVSHFEIITHIIDDVFGIENVGKFHAPSFGEVVNIEAHDTDDQNLVSLKVTYNGQTKEVLFDREKRVIEAE